MKEKKPIAKWIKIIIILSIIIVATIFIGSMVLYLGSYVMQGLEIFFGWMKYAFRWLGRVLDFFHITGIFGG